MAHNELRNDELSPDDVPHHDADWRSIGRFALTFNGYEHWGSFEKCVEVARGVGADATLTELRTFLFFEQRSWRHVGEEPDAARLETIRSVLDRIRAKIAAGDVE